jgi:hypothetical protein
MVETSRENRDSLKMQCVSVIERKKMEEEFVHPAGSDGWHLAG